MKIGICCYPTYGGSGAIATELGMELAERGHEIHFVSYAVPFRLSGYRGNVFFHEASMDHYPLFEHPPYTLALAATIHEVAQDHALDVIHSHYAIPHAASAWMAREMLGVPGGPRLITTLHGTDITLTGQQPSFHEITRFSIRKSDGVTAVSQFLKDETERSFGVPGERIRVIPNFVDTERFRRGREPCHRSSLAPAGEKLLMHVSNFRPLKRTEDVVEVFARVQRRVPSRLVMVGDGPERVRALQRAHDLGVADKVVFVGKHTSVDELLACADLFLLPSETESFGLAALEAMSCGAPVVASRVGGLPEVVEDGVSGALLPLGDVAGMAEAAVAILEDGARWRKMSEAARTVASERFAVGRVVPVYEDYYRSVLDEDSGEVG
ncbi:MAG: N-acetyl-alpha-D-glucosaminyl L-malate synthase BshA [Gemmatimonadota bacterium]